MALARLALLLPLLAFAPPVDAYLGVMFDDKEKPTVAEVIPGSPAEKSGIKVGDVFVSIDGVAMPDVDSVREAMRKHQPNDAVKVKIRRGNEDLEIAVRLGKRFDEPEKPTKAEREKPAPDKPKADKADKTDKAEKGERQDKPEAQAGGSAYLGISVEEEQGGLVVVTVLPGSPAERGGLRGGDRLTRVGGEATKTTDALTGVLGRRKPGAQVEVVVTRDGKEQQLTVRLGASPSGAPGKAETDRPREPAKAPPGGAMPHKDAREPAPPPAKVVHNDRLDGVLGEARRKEGRALVVIGASWSASSQAMQRTLEHPALQDVLARFALLRIDSDRDGKLTDELGVNEVPSLVVLAAGGKILGVQQGYLSPDMLRPWLEKNLAPRGAQAGDAKASPAEARSPREPRSGDAEAMPELRAEVTRLRAEIETLKAEIKRLSAEIRGRGR